jgi:hypothetical protein
VTRMETLHVKSKGTSVVDYCISNVHFRKKIHWLKVLEFFSLLSDVHCPLSITLLVNSFLINIFLKI